MDKLFDAVPIIGGTTPSQNIEKGKGARIYRECKFSPILNLDPSKAPTNDSNKFVDLSPGKYNGAELGEVMGVKPAKGFVVKLYKTPDYSGNSLTIADDSKTCLENNAEWYKQIKSIEIKSVEGFGMQTIMNLSILDWIIIVLLVVVAFLLWKRS